MQFCSHYEHGEIVNNNGACVLCDLRERVRNLEERVVALLNKERAE